MVEQNLYLSTFVFLALTRAICDLSTVMSVCIILATLDFSDWFQ